MDRIKNTSLWDEDITSATMKETRELLENAMKSTITAP